MQEPGLPPDEGVRLQSLHALGVLDTQPEERFDRITRLALLAVDVPVALVSLVDANRQWFKSCYGLDASETGRDVSFCGHAIFSKDPLIVPDALEDERFVHNPLVTGEPHIRFYAGFPLDDGAGHILGTLCVIDHRPRQLTESQLELLGDLASMAATELTTIARTEAIRQRNLILRRYEATIEAIDEGLVTSDLKGRIIDVNAGVETIFGYDRGELKDEHISVLLPPGCHEQLQTDTSRGAEIIGQRHDGGALVLHLTSRLTISDEDSLVITAISDITRHKEMEESLRHSEEFHRSVVSAMHDAVMILDADGTVITANESARELALLTDTPLVGQDLLDSARIDADGNPMPLDQLPLARTLRTGEPISREVVGLAAGTGDHRWVEISTQPLIRPDEERPHAIVVTMHDITDRLASTG